MNDDEIIQKLQSIFDDLIDENPPKVIPALSANDVDEWDSLLNIQIMVAAERAFGISIAAADIERLQNIGELMQLITSQL